MIYLEQSTLPQVVKIPRNLAAVPEGDYAFSVMNTIDRTTVTVIPSAVVLGALSYTTTVALPDMMPIGEYDYELRKGGIVLSIGLLTIGDYNYERTEYDAEAAYRQYEG